MPLGYVSRLGATRLVHWLALVAPSCLRSHNARYVMLKSFKQLWDRCQSFCILSTNSMHVIMGWAKGGGDAITISWSRISYLNIDHALQCSMRTVRVPIARYRKTYPRSELPYMGSACPASAWTRLGPTKRPTFCWWIVWMRCVQRQYCILKNNCCS